MMLAMVFAATLDRTIVFARCSLDPVMRFSSATLDQTIHFGATLG
jgi:hypothetical protein